MQLLLGRDAKLSAYKSTSKTLLAPLEHLHACNVNKFKLQVQLHRFILETEYFIPVAAMYIVGIHPDLHGPRVITIDRATDDAQPLLSRELRIRDD